MKRWILGFSILYLLTSFNFYYGFFDIPLETNSATLYQIYLLSLFIFPFVFGYIILQFVPDEFQRQKSMGCVFFILMFGLLIHNFGWTFLISMGGFYKDEEVGYPDPENKRLQVIRQYKDQGAMGGHYRTIEAYELTPFLRYVKSESFDR